LSVSAPGGAAPAGGPTVLRMLLGAQLRRLRETASVTRDDAGYHIRASGSKISRMELGRVSFKERDVTDLLEFYGVDDFDHSHHFNPVVVKHEDELVCHTQRIEIIQQRMIVLQEMAKKIITEQICEVETQTIVFQQYHRALGGFHHDLTRGSGRHVGYDNSIVSHYGQIYNSDGSFNTEDWGFKGTDVGSNYYSPSSNWNEETSYDSVGKAYQAAHFATFD